MAKKLPNREKTRIEKSPFDRRRSRRFDDSAPMPRWFQKILREELLRSTPCIQDEMETTLPAIDLLILNLMGQAMKGHVAAFDMALAHAPLDSEDDKARAKEEETKRSNEPLLNALAEWRRRNGIE